jgi:electron transfer flavoprotein beta subunit
MNIVVCVKLTPDASDIEARPDGTISLERAEWGIGSFDLHAVEAGMLLAEGSSGKVIALTAGPARINQSKLKKDILSRGPDELVMIADEALANADTAVTARVLTAAIQQLDAVDLVLCGEGSADLYFQQVGLQLGELLDLPTLNAVSSISHGGAAAGQELRVERSLEDEIEVLDVPLPAVLSVTTDINQARLPTMKEILKASKKPVTEMSLAELGLENLQSQVETLSTHTPPQVQRKGVALSGTPQEIAQALLEHLRKDGVI